MRSIASPSRESAASKASFLFERGNDARCARADGVGRMGRSGIRPYQTQLATKVLHVNVGKITSYVGGYDYFFEKTGALEDERAALTAG